MRPALDNRPHAGLAKPSLDATADEGLSDVDRGNFMAGFLEKVQAAIDRLRGVVAG
jgi:hypothetical protein